MWKLLLKAPRPYKRPFRSALPRFLLFSIIILESAVGIFHVDRFGLCTLLKTQFASAANDGILQNQNSTLDPVRPAKVSSIHPEKKANAKVEIGITEK